MFTIYVDPLGKGAWTPKIWVWTVDNNVDVKRKFLHVVCIRAYSIVIQCYCLYQSIVHINTGSCHVFLHLSSGSPETERRIGC